MKRRHALIALATSATLLIALTGCATPSQPVGPSGEPTSRSASMKNERLCVKNDSPGPVFVVWSNASSVDRLDGHILNAGGTNCATASSTGENGLSVRVRWQEDRLSQLFTIYNQGLSAPIVVVDGDEQTDDDLASCGQVFDVNGASTCGASYVIGSSEIYTAYETHLSTMMRTRDSDNFIEFTLVLEQ